MRILVGTLLLFVASIQILNVPGVLEVGTDFVDVQILVLSAGSLIATLHVVIVLVRGNVLSSFPFPRRASCFVILGDVQLRSISSIQSLLHFRWLYVVLLFVASLYELLLGFFYTQRTYWTMALSANINVGHIWLKRLIFNLETGLLFQGQLTWFKHWLLPRFGLVHVQVASRCRGSERNLGTVIIQKSMLGSALDTTGLDNLIRNVCNYLRVFFVESWLSFWHFFPKLVWVLECIVSIL